MKSFEQFVNEKLAQRVDWDAYARKVADAYEAAPLFDKSVTKHWDALSQSNHTLYKRMLSKIKIENVTDDPYPDQATMKKDVEKTGILKVYTGDSEHPYWSVEDNLVFRAVHDYITHILTDTPFGLHGELRAVNTHMKMSTPEAWPALFTETAAQTCVCIVTGKFPVQKVAVIDGFSYKEIGKTKEEKE